MTKDELIARLEAATGADRELDAAIQLAVGGRIRSDGVPVWDGRFIGVGAYTSDVNAALKIVPVDWHLILQGVNQSWHADLRTTPFGTGGYAGGVSSTPALAICIAALKARHD